MINAPNETSSVPSATSSSSSNSNVVVGSNGSQQGGRIIQDRERDEATRTREAGGQRNSMYIGQVRQGEKNEFNDLRVAFNPIHHLLFSYRFRINSLITGSMIDPTPILKFLMLKLILFP